jgi:hypothetical protein
MGEVKRVFPKQVCKLCHVNYRTVHLLLNGRCIPSLYHYIHTAGNFGESCGKVAFSEYIKVVLVVVGFKETIQRLRHFGEKTLYM